MMTEGSYFFLIFLATICGTRLLLLNRKMGSPTIRGFRLRHYMYGVALTAVSLPISNLTIYAFGLALLADEIPMLLVKGLGYREQYWKYEEYYAPWSVAGVLVLILLAYVFREALAGLV